MVDKFTLGGIFPDLSDGYPFMIIIYQASCKRNVDGARTVDCNSGYCGLDLQFNSVSIPKLLYFLQQRVVCTNLAAVVAMRSNCFHFQDRKMILLKNLLLLPICRRCKL